MTAVARIANVIRVEESRYSTQSSEEQINRLAEAIAEDLGLRIENEQIKGDY